jgi:hypothetical protein
MLLGLKRQTLACRRARVRSTNKQAKAESLGKCAVSSSIRKCLSWHPRTSGAALKVRNQQTSDELYRIYDMRGEINRKSVRT